MIAHESDVRAYVREASGGKARWVEPALGSTPGLPDCWVPYTPRENDEPYSTMVHLELKAGEIKNGLLAYTVRPEQKREMIALKEDGVKAGFLVGVKRTQSLLFIRPTTEAIFGQLMVSAHTESFFETDLKAAHGFWSGVNFIFCD